MLRKCIYFALSNQVSVERAGLVVKYTVETLTGKAVNNVPAATTSSQMVLEMNVLSDIQVAECILASPSINLAWDVTTVDGMHLNEIHINTHTSSLQLPLNSFLAALQLIMHTTSTPHFDQLHPTTHTSTSLTHTKLSSA